MQRSGDGIEEGVKLGKVIGVAQRNSGGQDNDCRTGA